MNHEKNTLNRWRVLIGVLILFSLAALITIAVLDPPSWGGRSAQVLPWERTSQGPLSRVQAPPRWLSICGVLTALSLCGVLALYLFPVHIKRMEAAFCRPLGRLARLAILGLAGAILVLAASLSATFAMSTFPLAIILGSALFVIGFGGFVALAYALGKALIRPAGWEHVSPVIPLLLGTFLAFALTELPLLGIIIRVVIIFLSAGVAISTRFGTGRPWTLDPFTEG